MTCVLMLDLLGEIRARICVLLFCFYFLNEMKFT